MTTATIDRPVIQLYPYQKAFFADAHRVQVAIWCRQAGKDFTTACKGIDDALRTGQAWFIISLTQRQADATFDKCKLVAKGMKLAAAQIADGPEYIERDPETDMGFRCVARTLHLPGGGSVTSLPGRDPDTLAGLTGNVILTEFGLFPKGGYPHWRVVFPLATRGFKVIVISTPRAKNTKFYELVSDTETYSVHRVDIHRAVADGMPLRGEDGADITIDEFKALYGDEIGWRREYLCEFTGDLEALVKWNQLVAAGEAGRGLPFDCLRIDRGAGWESGAFRRLAKISGRAEIGWDVARHRHFSSLWVNVAYPGQPRRLRYLVLMTETTFALQRSILFELMDSHPHNVGVGDATGLGMDSNETLETKYPGRWQAHTFTVQGKREIGSHLMTAFDEGGQIIPPVDAPDNDHKFIATDIYAVQKEAGTDEKSLKLIESQNPLLPESHCDIAYSGGLAEKAATIRPPVFAMTVING